MRKLVIIATDDAGQYLPESINGFTIEFSVLQRKKTRTLFYKNGELVASIPHSMPFLIITNE